MVAARSAEFSESSINPPDEDENRNCPNHCILRQHGNTPYKPLNNLECIGDSPTGNVFEQRVTVTAPNGETIEIRRVVVELKKPTRNGDKHLVLLTNLPQETVDALTVAELYRTRWGIETAFQKSMVRTVLKPTIKRLAPAGRIKSNSGQSLSFIK